MFKERRLVVWAFVRTWDRDIFRCVAVAVLEHFGSDAPLELFVVGSMVAAAGDFVSIVSTFGMSNVLAEDYVGYLGSKYQRKLVDYSIFDLRQPKQCLQKVLRPLSAA